MIILPEKVITGDGKTVRKNCGVRVSHGRICKVDEIGRLKSEWPDETIRAYPGATLLPGLCDVHIHAGYLPADLAPGDRNDMLLAYYVEHKLRAALRRGITLVRDVGSPEEMGKALRVAQERGYVALPRVISCGAGLCITGGHFHFAYPGVVEADGIQELTKAIRQRFKDGYRWVKLMTTDQGATAEYSQEELNAAVEETHRLGGKLTVHATNPLGIQMCIDAGVDGIEHCCEMTEEQAELIAERGIAWTPTLLVYQRGYAAESAKARPDAEKLARYRRAVEGAEKNFLTNYRKGIYTVAGTDIETMPLAEELACMVALGLSPVEAIGIGTWNGAKLLGLGTETGLIQEGYAADLLVVEGDAEKEIKALQCPLLVMRQGEVVV